MILSSLSIRRIQLSGAQLRDRSDRVRGKHRLGTTGKAQTRTGKGGGETPALAQTNASPARRDEDMRDIKEQLSSLMQLVPVITEIKAAYDHYNDMERNDPDRHLSEAGPSLLETGESTDAAQDTPDTVGYFNTLTGHALLRRLKFIKNSLLVWRKYSPTECLRTLSAPS